MNTGTKIITHADIKIGTDTLSNYGYKNKDYNILPITFPKSNPQISEVQTREMPVF
jgi:hypothetical protein